MTIRDIMKNRVMILDGAMGTMLGKYETDQLPFPERLNLTDAALVADIHRRYADAGADIISTYTLKANRYHSNTHGVDLEKLIQSACRNARVGAPEAFIALSVGPLGQGKAHEAETWEAHYSAFSEVIGHGLKSGIDAILLESFQDIDEARMAILAARSLSDLPLLVSFAVCEQETAAMDALFEKIAVVIENLAVDAIGLNCGLSPEPMVANYMKLKTRVKKPLFVQPNAGRHKINGSKRLYLDNVEAFKTAMARCVSEGAALIGGCCGTTPQYIQGISRLKKTYSYPVKKNVFFHQHIKTECLEPVLGALIAKPFKTTGSGGLKRALTGRDSKCILAEAERLHRSGFDRMALHGDETIDSSYMRDLVLKLSHETCMQLVLSAADVAALEAMLAVYPGRAIITGSWPTVKARHEVYRLSKRYGAEVVLNVEVCAGPLTYEQRVLQALDILVNEAQNAGVERKLLIFQIDVEKAQHDGATYSEVLALIRTLRSTQQVQTYVHLEGLAQSSQECDALASTFCVLAMAQGLSYLAVNAEKPIYAHLLKGLKAMHGVKAAVS